MPDQTESLLFRMKIHYSHSWPRAQESIALTGACQRFGTQVRRLKTCGTGKLDNHSKERNGIQTHCQVCTTALELERVGARLANTTDVEGTLC